MKKIALILVALLVAGFAFADGHVTVDGDATLTWGVDLDSNATGFTNESSASIEVELVAEESAMMDGDALYGYIALEDFEVVIDEDGLSVTAPDVSAKLILSPEAYLLVYGAPSDATGMASSFEYIDESNEDAEFDFASQDLGTSGGAAIGYDFGMGDIEVGVMSHGDWTSTAAGTDVYGWTDDGTGNPTWGITEAASAAVAANTTNQYSVSAFVGLAPADIISIAAGVVYGPFDGGNLGLESQFTIAPMDMVDLVIAFDGTLPNGGDFAYDATVDLDLDLGVATFGAFAYYSAEILEAQITLGVSAVENLTFDVTADLINLAGTAAGTLDYAVQVALTYTIDTIMPYATVDYYFSDLIGLDAGVEVALAPNTTFDFNYNTSDLGTVLGVVTAALEIAY